MTEAISKITDETADRLELRDYQHDAVNKWFENDRRGIFEMATGTGKTWTAIKCIKRIFESEFHRQSSNNCMPIQAFDNSMAARA